MFIAATATVFGQALPGTKAVPLTCAANDPLNPIAGRPYDYTAIINPTGGTAYWYATKSTTFTTAGARVAVEIPADGAAIATGAVNYRTSAVSATSPTKTTVTWTSAGLDGVDATTKPLFMVVEYAGATCADNLKVMQILPKVAFTVDITNMKHGATPTPLAYGTAENQCFDKVQSAKFNAGKIEIDYGTNVLYFEVIGANFTGTYKPTLKLSGIIEGQRDMWFIFKGHIPAMIAFLVFIIAGTAETNRGPFDLAEAESELTAGFHTEYSGIKFAFFFLAEYINLFIVAAMATIVFLGG